MTKARKNETGEAIRNVLLNLLIPNSTVGSMSRRQLPASRGDVLPARSPDERGHVALDQNLLETQDSLHRRRSIRQFGRGGVRDQVHFRPNALKQFHQPPTRLLGIVDA